MFALFVALFALPRGELLGADFRLKVETPESNHEAEPSVYGDDLAAKLLQMRFYIWNKHQPFLPRPGGGALCPDGVCVPGFNSKEVCDAKAKSAKEACRKDKRAARKACDEKERAARKTCIAEGKADQAAWDKNHTLVIKEPGWSADWLTYGGEIIDPLQGMTSKIFDPTLKTQFMIHGFSARAPYGGASLIMMSHQARGDFDDYNFIALDWRGLAGFQWANSGGIGHFDSDGYGPAAHNTQPAGERAAHMLLKLLTDQFGTSSKTAYLSTLANVHVIGHSLGCHVAGNMGRTITTLAGQKLTHITAMEPAGPKFVDGNCENIAIQKSDAIYIEAIHTDGALNMPFVERGRLGDLRSNMGDANWYFNGGEKQPGCTMEPFGMLCDHQRSFHFYAESVANPKAFRGFRCALVPSSLGWLFMDKTGCIKDPPQISDLGVTAYLTDEYGSNKPLGDYAVVTTATYPFTDATWNSQQ